MPLVQESFTSQCIPTSQQGDLSANTRDTRASFENYQQRVALQAAVMEKQPWKEITHRSIQQRWTTPAKTVELGELQPHGHDSFPNSCSFLLAFLTSKGLTWGTDILLS